MGQGGFRISAIERWAPIGGVLFVALMVVGSFFVSDVPNADASGQEIADYLADSDRHTRNIIGAYIWIVGALAFLWFLTRLRSDLRKAEGGAGVLSNLAFGAGVAFSAVWMVSAAAYASVAFAVEFRDAPVSDPDLVRVLPSLGGLLLLVGGGFAGLLLLVAASAVILRTGVLPRWLAWLAIVASDRSAFRRGLSQHRPVVDLGVPCLHRDASATPGDGGGGGGGGEARSEARTRGRRPHTRRAAPP